MAILIKRMFASQGLNRTERRYVPAASEHERNKRNSIIRVCWTNSGPDDDIFVGAMHLCLEAFRHLPCTHATIIDYRLQSRGSTFRPFFVDMTRSLDLLTP